MYLGLVMLDQNVLIRPVIPVEVNSHEVFKIAIFSDSKSIFLELDADSDVREISCELPKL